MTWENEFATEDGIITLLKRIGALLSGHFVLTSRPEGSLYRRHSSVYVNKDALSCEPEYVHNIAIDLVNSQSCFEEVGVDVVVAPAIGAIVLGAFVAEQAGSNFAYAEPDGDDKMVFKRGFDKLISHGKKVVIVEDIVTSGATLKKMVTAVRELDGEIVAVLILWQRGGEDIPEDVKIISVVTKEYPVWAAEECELCKAGVNISTEVGHGEEFLREFGIASDSWPANRSY